jgi:hypothetical protein
MTTNIIEECSEHGGIRALKGDHATMTERTIPLDAILALVRYLECDERKHFERIQYEGDDTSDHIYNEVRAVSDWLDGQPGIPTAVERERQRLAPIKEAFAQAGITGDFADFWQWEKQQAQ